MRRRHVIISPEALADLMHLEQWLLESTSVQTTTAYMERVLDFCDSLEIASERGHARDDLLQGLRIVGFERRLTVAFAVSENRVDVLRLFRSGRDWERDFSAE